MFANISGATSKTYSFIDAGQREWILASRAVFTNSQGTATTAAATLTVVTTVSGRHDESGELRASCRD